MDINKRLELITRNTVEIIGENELKDLLEKKKTPAVYLGTAITGKPHIGYFVWAIKLADFLKAGFKVKLLLADLHGALDNTPWDILEKRYKYYEAVIPLLFDAIGVSKENFEIVKGSSFQLKKEYFLDLLKMATFVSVHDANKAASEVVKLGDNPRLGGIIYPLMQALDEEYLKVDIQYGGIDQRKILVLAREVLPKLGYKPRVEVMTPLVPGLIGKKMSASDPKSKIDLLDGEKDVEEKVKGAYCAEGDINNGLIAFAEFVIFVIKRDIKEKFIVKRDKKYGGDISFSSIDELRSAFGEKRVHPFDLKEAIANEINGLLRPIQEKKSLLEKLAREAYP